MLRECSLHTIPSLSYEKVGDVGLKAGAGASEGLMPLLRMLAPAAPL